ncbi:MAG: winged helix-turn-helix domain-containing protein [Thermoproteota archaeon]|nr:winged helix-turn-helix domain-containing protein [Thermoproteota archaeon]
MKYRNRIDIMSKILEVANGGDATKTKIMYSVFLNYSQLKEYLAVLLESDLLIYDSLMHTFKTTEKGLRFLYTYNQVDHMIKAEI